MCAVSKVIWLYIKESVNQSLIVVAFLIYYFLYCCCITSSGLLWLKEKKKKIKLVVSNLKWWSANFCFKCSVGYVYFPAVLFICVLNNVICSYLVFFFSFSHDHPSYHIKQERVQVYNFILLLFYLQLNWFETANFRKKYMYYFNGQLTGNLIVII